LLHFVGRIPEESLDVKTQKTTKISRPTVCSITIVGRRLQCFGSRDHRVKKELSGLS